MLYSGLEPTAYTFMDSVIDPKPRRLVVNIFVALAVSASLVELGSAAHERRRLRAAPAASCELEQTAARPHSPMRFLTAVPFLTSAAFANAGLYLCTRYLDTTHSRDWFDRSAAGWSLFALLCLVAFFAAKAANLQAIRQVASPHWRIHLSTVWLLVYEHDTIAGIIIWRGATRVFLFPRQQRIFVGAAICRQGAGLCLLLEQYSPDDAPNLAAAAFLILIQVLLAVFCMGFLGFFLVGGAVLLKDGWSSRSRPVEGSEARNRRGNPTARPGREAQF
nr:hypothetical protein CFP56_20547 [Quercus suber]